MFISETVHSLELLSILVCPVFPLHLPNSFLLLLSPPPTPSSHREAPIVAPHVDSPFLWTVAKSGIWSEFEWCRYEPFRDTLSWKGHYRASRVQPLCFIDKEAVLQRVRASRQRSLRVSSQARVRILASWLLVCLSDYVSTQISCCCQCLVVLASPSSWL